MISRNKSLCGSEDEMINSPRDRSGEKLPQEGVFEPGRQKGTWIIQEMASKGMEIFFSHFSYVMTKNEKGVIE